MPFLVLETDQYMVTLIGDHNGESLPEGSILYLAKVILDSYVVTFVGKKMRKDV